jgi:hypothetical protein
VGLAGHTAAWSTSYVAGADLSEEEAHGNLDSVHLLDVPLSFREFPTP